MARQYKNPTFICIDCDTEVRRASPIQKRCKSCALESKRETARRASLNTFLKRKIHKIDCADCGVTVAFKGGCHRYCDACSKRRADKYGEEYKIKNIDVIRDKARERSRIARKTRVRDSATRLHENISSLVRRAISGKGGISWQDIVGYTRQDLMSHLERQFKRGMTWDNYGDWHVDHIVPRVAFDFEDKEDPEFKACWSLTNLMPLWAEDNLKKNRKRMYLI
jgi:hypothetical protein